MRLHELCQWLLKKHLMKVASMLGKIGAKLTNHFFLQCEYASLNLLELTKMEVAVLKMWILPPASQLMGSVFINNHPCRSVDYLCFVN